MFAIGTGSEGAPPSTPSTGPPSTSPPAPAAIEVTADELIQAYEANEVAADAKYEGKILNVTGVVDNVGKDIVDTPYVVLTSGGEWEVWGVQCMFDKEHEPELAQLAVGQTVTVQGRCSGYLINVLVRDCIIVH